MVFFSIQNVGLASEPCPANLYIDDSGFFIWATDASSSAAIKFFVEKIKGENQKNRMKIKKKKKKNSKLPSSMKFLSLSFSYSSSSSDSPSSSDSSSSSSFFLKKKLHIRNKIGKYESEAENCNDRAQSADKQNRVYLRFPGRCPAG